MIFKETLCGSVAQGKHKKIKGDKIIMDDKPYYLIGDVNIRNMDEYKIYMQNTKPIVESTVVNIW